MDWHMTVSRVTFESSVTFCAALRMVSGEQAASTWILYEFGAAEASEDAKALADSSKLPCLKRARASPAGAPACGAGGAGGAGVASGGGSGVGVAVVAGGGVAVVPAAGAVGATVGAAVGETAGAGAAATVTGAERAGVGAASGGVLVGSGSASGEGRSR